VSAILSRCQAELDNEDTKPDKSWFIEAIRKVTDRELDILIEVIGSWRREEATEGLAEPEGWVERDPDGVPRPKPSATDHRPSDAWFAQFSKDYRGGGPGREWQLGQREALLEPGAEEEEVIGFGPA
jgi:hypothetical protein